MTDTAPETRAAVLAWVSDELRSLELADASAPLDEETGLFGRGIGLDSIEIMRLAVAMETRYDLTIEDDELTPETFRTIGTLVDFILEKIDEAGQ